MSENHSNLRSRQMNPCDHLFWTSRGYPCRPYNWRDELYNIGYYDDDDDYNYNDYDDYNSYNNYEDNYYWNDWNDPDYYYQDNYYDNYDYEYDEDEDDGYSEWREQNNLRSRQMNPCDQLFWKSRGYPCKPYNWRDELYNIGYYDDNQEWNNVDQSKAELKQKQNNLPSNHDLIEQLNSISRELAEIKQDLKKQYQANRNSNVITNNTTASASSPVGQGLKQATNNLSRDFPSNLPSGHGRINSASRVLAEVKSASSANNQGLKQEKNNFPSLKMNTVYGLGSKSENPKPFHMANASYSSVTKTIQKNNSPSPKMNTVIDDLCSKFENLKPLNMANVQKRNFIYLSATAA